MSIKLTEKRKDILAVLEKTRGTLTAAEIHKKLPDIDLATIYRNLDLFVKEKLIREIHFNKKEAQYEYQNESHHHAVCNECEKIIHFKAPDKKIMKLLGLDDFDVDEIEVTVRGTCRNKEK